jgi:hypothetical protein
MPALTVYFVQLAGPRESDRLATLWAGLDIEEARQFAEATSPEAAVRTGDEILREDGVAEYIAALAAVEAELQQALDALEGASP